MAMTANQLSIIDAIVHNDMPKGKTIKPPFGKVSVDDFMTYLEDAENEAVDSWNKGDCTH